MRYLSWSAFYEGASDALYFDVLIPRIIRDMVAREGNDVVEIPEVAAMKLGSSGRSIDQVAAEVCRARDAYDIVFIHADTGGRSLERTLERRSGAYCQAIARLCAWPEDRCITITPRHETEAWLIADGSAVMGALGYTGAVADVGLPANARDAERHSDPKTILNAAVEKIAGRRRTQSIERLFPAIAQRQDLVMLRECSSFGDLERRLRLCLRSMNIIADGT